MVFELRGVPAKPSDDIYDGWVEALDGTPRVIPVAFDFDGSRFVLGTIDFSAKVRAIQANPAVALTVDTSDQPPLVLMVLGVAVFSSSVDDRSETSHVHSRRQSG